MLQQARPNRLKVTALAYLQVHLMCISPIYKCQTSTDSTSTRISQSQQNLNLYSHFNNKPPLFCR